MLRLRVQGRKAHGPLSGLRGRDERPARVLNENGRCGQRPLQTEDAAFLDIITGKM